MAAFPATRGAYHNTKCYENEQRNYSFFIKRIKLNFIFYISKMYDFKLGETNTIVNCQAIRKWKMLPVSYPNLRDYWFVIIFLLLSLFEHLKTWLFSFCNKTILGEHVSEQLPTSFLSSSFLKNFSLKNFSQVFFEELLWSNFRDSHESFCDGVLFLVTLKDVGLLNASTKYNEADLAPEYDPCSGLMFVMVCIFYFKYFFIEIFT